MFAQKQREQSWESEAGEDCQVHLEKNLIDKSIGSLFFLERKSAGALERGEGILNWPVKNKESRQDLPQEAYSSISLISIKSERKRNE